MLVDMGRLVGLLLVCFAMASCRSEETSPDASIDLMCTYTDVGPTGSACAGASLVKGTCFEEPLCVCVLPEGTWACCSAEYGYQDDSFAGAGKPCCGYGNSGPGNWPGSPCYCDNTYHWACPADLGTTD
jgi:hypothetical protein